MSKIRHDNFQPGKYKYILPIKAKEASLEMVGGKGRSLAKMAITGLPVPPGFHLTTSAYNRFVEENNLQDTIISLAKPEITGKTVSFETAAQRIQELIRKPELSDEMKEEIRQVYKSLGGKNPAVAVRSSANAEDLPELSFAGQQETYLNVCGADALIAAVRNCWASLWTPRAISYRHQMGIPQDAVAMAVVVQVMIPAEVSGILFTANPATGERTEIVINASFGLGEAVVGGHVTPDTFIVDRKYLTIKETTLGAKEQMIVSSGEQGTTTEPVAKSRRTESSLPASLLGELSSLAIKVEQLFDGLPQDIEWAIANEKLWLLQARPITNLPSQPLKDVRWDPPEPGAFLARSQLVEHIPGPVSTLFEDMYMKKYLQEEWGRNLAKNKKHRLEDTQPPSSFIVSTTVNGFAYRHIGEPPRSYGMKEIKRRRPTLFARISMQIRIYVGWVIKWRFWTLPSYLNIIDRWRQVNPATASVGQLWAGIRELAHADANYWYQGTYWPFAVARGMESLLINFLQKHAPGRFTSGQFLSGLKSRAMQAQMDLCSIAQLIRSNETIWKLIVTIPPQRLLDELRHQCKGTPVLEAIERYFKTYGHQIYTLDFVEPTMAEDPQQVLRNLKILVQDSNYNPIVQHQELIRKREAAIKEAKQIFRGILWWKFRWRLWLAQHYYPGREEAMFYFGAAWSVLRPLALELGRRLVEVGTLEKSSDIFFLTSNELGKAVRALVGNWMVPVKSILEQQGNKPVPGLLQKARSRRELRNARKLLSPPEHIPPLPEDHTPSITDNFAEKYGDALNGSPVSPGKVTAIASLILSPADFEKMVPGTILVCPTTTPAWTPLFTQAKGLVTDIGGILAHGAIVAREYGIPAVLGTSDATKRIVSGQQITVDGNKGIVTLGDSSNSIETSTSDIHSPQ